MIACISTALILSTSRPARSFGAPLRSASDAARRHGLEADESEGLVGAVGQHRVRAAEQEAPCAGVEVRLQHHDVDVVGVRDHLHGVRVVRQVVRYQQLLTLDRVELLGVAVLGRETGRLQCEQPEAGERQEPGTVEQGAGQHDRAEADASDGSAGQRLQNTPDQILDRQGERHLGKSEARQEISE